MARTTDAARGPSLALRLFGLSALLVLIALGGAALITQLVGQRLVAAAADEALADGAALHAAAAQRRLQLIERTAALIARDADLVAYVAAALEPDIGVGDGPAYDAASLRDLLAERRTQFGLDLAWLLDADGTLLARGDGGEVFDASLADDALVAPALGELAPQSGYWRDDARLFQAAVVPLAQRGALVGFLLLGAEVNDAWCSEIARGTGAQLAVWLPGADDGTGSGGVVRVASSLAPAQSAALDAATPRHGEALDVVRLGRGTERSTLVLGGEPWLARWQPLAAGAPVLGATSTLVARDSVAAGYDRLLEVVWIAGIASLVLALPLSLWWSRRLLRPVHRLAEAAERAAEGDYHADIATAAGAHGRDELGRLSRAFDSLLSDLREKHDMEVFVADVSRFLPDGGQPAATPASAPRAARSLTMLLLGVEHAPPASADAAAARASEPSPVRSAAAASSAGVHDDGGARAWLWWTWPDDAAAASAALDDALAAAAALLAAEPGAALALASGEAVVDADGAPLGAARYQLDRLLSESAPGRVLLARALGDRVRERHGTEALQVAEGALSKRRYYALRVAGLPAALHERKAGPAPDATVALPTPVRAHDTHAPLPRAFGDRYELLAALGAGGMGVVYKAHDRELDDMVALKMLRPGVVADDVLDRLKDEIRLARRITHPNVLRTFDFGEIDGRPFISMEYVRGVTLRDLLRQSGALPYSAGLRIARQLAAGLAAAHEVGVLHRDIKPENIIIDIGGTARLMDFGIARPLRRDDPGLTLPGTFVGTVSYCAPEQLAGDRVDARADLYACGVVMYETFTGALPFAAEQAAALYLAQMQQEPERPSTHWSEMPVALEAIILRCLARRREDRFARADELADALAELRA